MPYGLPGESHYAQGDYYQGDLIDTGWKALKKEARKQAGKAIQKYLGGAPGGPPPITIETGGGGLWPRGWGKTLAPLETQGIPQVPVPGPGGAIQRFLPGGKSGYLTAGYGYHANKAYVRYLRAKEQGRDVEDPTKEPRVTNLIVRNRSLNPTNPRALRRAIRRTQAFVSLARRCIAGSGYTIKRTGLGGKKKGRACATRRR